MLSLGKLLLFAARDAAYLLSWCLGARCCCGCRSLAVLAIRYSLVMLAFAVCCRLLAVLVLSTTAATTAVHLLSLSW
ncbi:hypothetical protein MAM1_0313d09550 [Mucor ambiguus]|uniref:Uncharacterized protein n=1 Tax=Mucor ambiguus TaxID=91626 RepID=A0A0C9MGY0_9FUNG|nr:hypothetical protein MAM1_0313d09550 [Mucor ambiguus]